MATATTNVGCTVGRSADTTASSPFTGTSASSPSGGGNISRRLTPGSGHAAVARTCLSPPGANCRPGTVALDVELQPGTVRGDRLYSLDGGFEGLDAERASTLA